MLDEVRFIDPPLPLRIPFSLPSSSASTAPGSAPEPACGRGREQWQR